MVAGKVEAESNGPSQLQLEPNDGVACKHSVVGRGGSEHMARRDNQLVLELLVAKKCSID